MWLLGIVRRRKKSKRECSENIFGMHIIAKEMIRKLRGKKYPWKSLSHNQLQTIMSIWFFFCWEKKIKCYLYNYVNKSEGRFHDQPGFEYAALTLNPLLCSTLTDKNFITQPSSGQETNRPWSQCARELEKYGN